MSKKINELFYLRPWAIKQDFLHVMSNIVERHMRGEKLSEDVIAKVTAGKKEQREYEIINGTAVIPIQGIISKRIGLIQQISNNGVSTLDIKKDLLQALEDKQVKNILLYIDSPGGSVDGPGDLADFIFSIRNKKPIYSFSDGQMDSAAYWIGSAAEKVYATKGAEIGSIGVYAIIDDYTVMAHNMGIKTEIIKAGKHKATGHPEKPFTAEDREIIQERVNDYYDLFVEGVAQNRGISTEETLKLATGDVFIGRKAKKAGLIDAITTLDDIIAEMNTLGGEAGESKSHASIRSQTGADINNKKISKEEVNMDLKSLTKDALQKENPELVNALIQEGKDSVDLKPIEEKAAKDATAKEQTRITGILAKGKELGIKDEVINEAITAGDTVEAAASKFKDIKLKELQGNAPKSPGPGLDGNTSAGEEPTLEEKCEREWKENAALRQEFTSKEAYIRFRKAEEGGRVKLLRK